MLSKSHFLTTILSKHRFIVSAQLEVAIFFIMLPLYNMPFTGLKSFTFPHIVIITITIITIEKYQRAPIVIVIS